jgi:hypothetical protein
MVFKGKKSCFGISALLMLTAFIGIQSSGAAAGELMITLIGDTIECNSLFFMVGGSYSPESAVVQYRWDFGEGWTAWSSDSYAEYMWLDDFSGTVMMEVSDGGLVSTAMIEVHVLNVPPYILSADGPVDSPEVGTSMMVTVHYFDGDLRNGIASLDACTAVYSWGDGTSTPYSLEAGATEVVGSHTYTKGGDYDITIILTDDDGGVSQAATHVVVTQSSASIETLIGLVADLKISKGIQNSLFSKLGVSDLSHRSPQVHVEMNRLKAFINYVEAQRGKQFSRQQAESLIDTAQRIIDSLRSR